MHGLDTALSVEDSVGWPIGFQGIGLLKHKYKLISVILMALVAMERCLLSFLQSNLTRTHHKRN